MDDIINIIKKKGFRDTMEILLANGDGKMDKHEFYEKLNDFSHYNSFFRVKEGLINGGIIEMGKNGRDEYIRLTPKGRYICKKLNEMNAIINHN